MCNLEQFFAPVEKFPGVCFTSATPLRVVRVEKFPGVFSIGAALAADLFAAIAHFPTTPQSVLHQCRNSLGISPPIPPSMELRWWRRIPGISQLVQKNRIANINITSARKNAGMPNVRHRGLKHPTPSILRILTRQRQRRSSMEAWKINNIFNC